MNRRTLLPLGDSRHEPYNAPRGTCPSCGSGEVVHLIIGMPIGQDVMDGDPDWVHWVGCMHPGFDRECYACGATWNSRAVESPRPIRLLSEVGVSFALLPVPNLVTDDEPYTHLVDVELLTHDRLVRYLARTLSRDTLVRLSEAWTQAAHDTYPEVTIPAIQDDGAGLAVLITESTPDLVTLEISIETDLSGDAPGQDGVVFDVPRSALTDAAHAVEGWLG
ncbi:hypothetical protein BN12_2620024 [Nostocoides japonicum T1-X7]|uniref:Uncharacterized protein n=1 Tax=Nostocoides japonicum T1-X7 TaxID=1194083 RepID=A0A077M1W6_9MICO|nr:hypothetical protein [Tetrasphaera japonica]CCH78209.1 hypothetical protein BN12_2620024 [Tetrasphaera japonica T1-X7]